MCYSTNGIVDLKQEVTYYESLPYGKNGYRTDCNNIPVNMLLWLLVLMGISFFSCKSIPQLPCCET